MAKSGAIVTQQRISKVKRARGEPIPADTVTVKINGSGINKGILPPPPIPLAVIQPGELVAKFKAWLANYTGQPKTGGMSITFTVTSDELAAVYPLTALTGLMFEVHITRPAERERRSIIEMAERTERGANDDWDDAANEDRTVRMKVEKKTPGLRPDAPGLQPDAPGLV